MKQALINSLKIDTITRLSIEEKAQVISKLRDKYELSYRDLSKLTGIPHSTLLDWVTGRQKNVPGTLHISIRSLVNHFKVYEPKSLEEWCALEELKKVIDERLKQNDTPKNKLNKVIGWKEK